MDERELAEQLRGLAAHVDAESRTVHPVTAMEHTPGRDPRRRRQLVGAAAAALAVAGTIALIVDDDGRQPVDAVTPPTTETTSSTTSTTSSTVSEDANTFAGTPPEEWPASGIVVVEGERAVLLDHDGTELGEVRGPVLSGMGVGPEQTSIVVRPGPSFEVEGPPTVDAPTRCDTGAGGGGIRVVLCGGEPQIRERIVSVDPTGATEELFGDAPGSLDAGHWRWALPSPDGEWILGQWSGECEVPTAFFLPVAGGEPRTVDGAATVGEGVESFGVGWAPDGRAVVQLVGGGCGAGADEPGTYLVDPASGDRTLVRAAAAGGSRAYTWRRAGYSNDVERTFARALAELGVEGCCGEPSHGGPAVSSGIVWDGVDIPAGGIPFVAPATMSFNAAVSSEPIDIDGASATAVTSGGFTSVVFTCGDAIWRFGGEWLDAPVRLSDLRAAAAAVIPHLYCTVGEPPRVAGKETP